LNENKGLRSQAFFGTESINKLLLKFAVPAIISMVVNSIYNIVDQIFIGWGVGYIGNAATTACFPLVTIAMALSLMISDGGVAFFSLRMGEKKHEMAQKALGNGMFLAALAGIVYLVACESFMPGLLKLFGASDTVMPYAKSYGYITVAGVPFVMIGMLISAIIRADGNPRYAMFCMLAGAVANIGLDALFVFVFKWGVVGAAVATVIGQVLNFTLAIAYLPRLRSVTFEWKSTKPEGKIIRGIVALGLSSFITQLSITVAAVTMNRVLSKYGAASKYGSDIPMAAFGIVMKVNQILTSVIIGIVIGAQPIEGYNYGAKNYERVRKTYLLGAAYATIAAVIAWIIFQTRTDALIRIFGQTSELYIEFARMAFKKFLLTIFLAGVTIGSGVFFQAIGKPLKAMISSILRQIGFFVPCTLILSSKYGIEGTLYGGPCADVLAFLCVATLVVLEMIDLNKKIKARDLENSR